MKRYARHADLRLTALDGEGVVLHLGSRRYYSVSESGLDLLEALVEPRTIEELVATLTAKYDVGADTAAASVREFLEQGVRTGLLNTTDSD
jgi:hypothetical protein